MTAAVSVVVPVDVNETAPSAPFIAPPTTPVKVMLPEPVVAVSALFAKATEFTVELNINAPFAVLLALVFIVTLAFNVTAPVYVWAPDVFTLPPTEIPLVDVALKLVSAVPDPTMPPKVIAPEPEPIVKLVPFTMLLTA